MRHITRMLLGTTAVQFMLAPEGGGDGDGGGGGGGGGGGAAFSAPDGMPAEFVGKDAGETLGKLWAGHQALTTRAEGLRGELARVPKAPGKPEDYTYRPSDKLAPFFGQDYTKNPALTAARAAAHKHGISDAAFSGMIEDTYGPLLEQGILTGPFDAKAELKSFAEANALDDRAATAAITEAVNFAKGLAGQLRVPEALQKDVAAQLEVLADTAAGATLLRALSQRLADSGIRIPVDSSSTYQGQMTDADLDKLTSDPRIDPANEFKQDPNLKFDPVLRKRYDEGMAERGRRKYAGKQ